LEESYRGYRGESDFFVPTKRFVNKASANKNRCGDSFTLYGDRYHYCEQFILLFLITKIITTTILVS